MFWKRLISGVVLLVIAIATFFYGGLPLLAVLLLISLIAFRELTKAMQCGGGEKRFNALDVIGLCGIATYYALCYFGLANGWDKTVLLAAITMTLMGNLFAYVLTFPKFQAQQVAAATFAFLYAPVMLSTVYLTRELPEGIYLVWLILISSWGCDTCAYVVGVLIGKKKIFPHLSPKKSLEGCIGGVAGAMLIGGLYAYFFVSSKMQMQDAVVIWSIVLISGVGAVMSMVGDLAASAIKRNHGIKDYGNLIPGHGGVMDRFDSMIVTAPMVYFLAVFLLY